MTARRLGRRAGFAFLGLASLAVLNGCTTFGGNVNGNFTCQAPDGLCAPSSTIDDRALAMVSGDAGDTMIPAGPYQAPAQKPRASRTALSAPSPVARTAVSAAASRTREKVLRIVFQPYIDDRGRLHEASAVHTVVQSEWQAQVLADATPIPDRNQAAAQPAEVSLADAVDRGAPGFVDVAAIDPNLPDPEVVAAARARKPDPIEAIKADVKTKLAQGAKRRTTTASPAPSGTRTSSVAPLHLTPAHSAALSLGPDERASNPAKITLPPAVLVHGGPAPAAAGAQAALVSPSKTASGPEAAARVKASEAYRGGQALVEESPRGARTGALQTGLEVLGNPTIRAASFPAAVPEDK